MSVCRCGRIALVGRPNAGKSTLLNRCIGTKLSITSRKPQTTRHRLLGVCTQENIQYIFLDTPGLNRKYRCRLDQSMARVVSQAVEEVDVLVWVMDASSSHADDFSLARVFPAHIPLIIVANKIDLFPAHAAFRSQFETQLTEAAISFSSLCWLSASYNQGVKDFLKEVALFLPEQPFFYSEDTLTDRSERFLVGEIIREKVFRCLGDELPYSTTVQVDSFREEEKRVFISAFIYVGKEGHKKIVIGHKARLIKMIGVASREDIERFLDRRVFLDLRVKTKTGWTDDSLYLNSLGYDCTGQDKTCRPDSF